MNISLYSAVDELRSVLDQVNEETGELPEGYESARGLVANKSAKVAAYIAQTEAEATMVETHAKSLLDRVKAAKKRNDWLKRYLLENMARAGITEIASPEGLTIKRYPERDKSVEVWDEKQVPAEYLADPMPPPISKTKIKAALDNGIDVPGARIVARDRLTIR